jgi:hypothetical protein
MLRNQAATHYARLTLFCLILAVTRANDAVTTAAWQRLHGQAQRTLAALGNSSAALPAPEAGVADVSFREFFAPAGDAGLEYSARLRELTGKRVRLVGYMVREPQRQHGVFVLAPFPTTVEAGGACFADDVPAVAVHVHLPPGRSQAIAAFQPGRLVLTGVLEIGMQHEADGRNSAVRLRLEEPQ